MKKALGFISGILLLVFLAACLPPPPPSLLRTTPQAAESAVPEEITVLPPDKTERLNQNYMLPLVAPSSGQWYLWWEDEDRREPIGRLSQGEIYAYYYADGDVPDAFISEYNDVFRTVAYPASSQLCILRLELPCKTDQAVLQNQEGDVVCSTRRDLENPLRPAYQVGDYLFMIAPVGSELALKLSHHSDAGETDDGAGKFECILKDLDLASGRVTVEGNFSPNSRLLREETRALELSVAAWPTLRATEAEALS